MINMSIVFTVYNSHEIVRRQIEYFKKMNLPDDIEIIIMDDESSPPLDFSNCGLKNLSIYRTGNKAPWTQALARNQSIEKAKGEKLLFTDIDHFFPKETIMACREFDGDKMMFNRQYAIIDENGDFCQDKKVLKLYGLKRGKLRRSRHNNSFVIKKSVYQRLGGYHKKYWENRYHRSGDSSFFTSYNKASRRGKFSLAVTENIIYTFPGSNPDPLGLFHKLNRQDEPIKEDKVNIMKTNRFRKEYTGHIFDRIKGLEIVLKDCKNYSILDLGSCDGLISYEFARHGASIIHGFDIKRKFIEFSKTLFKATPVKSEFCIANLDCEYDDFEKKFKNILLNKYDITLYLGVRLYSKDFLKQIVLKTKKFFIIRAKKDRASHEVIVNNGFRLLYKVNTTGLQQLRVYEKI